MRLSTGQHAVRLTCGLGLLLMPAVQQKVCTFPVRRESEPQRPAPPTPNSDEQQKNKNKKPLTLVALLPDVAPPRWPNHTHLTAVQRVRPLPITTWMSGPEDFENESAVAGHVNAFLAGGWPRIPPPQRLASFGVAGLRLVRPARHAFLTSVLRTGPPHA